MKIFQHNNPGKGILMDMIAESETTKVASTEAYKRFFASFKFNQGGALLLGVEEEARVKSAGTGLIVTSMPKILPLIVDYGWESEDGRTRINPGPFVDMEAFAAQSEIRYGPCKTLEELRAKCRWTKREFKGSLARFGLRPCFDEFGPPDTPIVVSPKERYHQIVDSWSPEKKTATARITATHVHIGMPDAPTALRVYNGVIPSCKELCEMGDHSGGARLDVLRRVIAPGFADPVPFASWEHLYQFACENNFAEDLGKWWSLVRLTVHGTIEFRMFGSTESVDEIMLWAETCLNLCRAAMLQDGR